MKKQASKSLNVEIRRLIRELGMGQEEAAIQARMSYPDLRKQLSQNCYYSDDVVRLCQVLGLPDDLQEVQRRFEFTIQAGQRGARLLTSGKSPSPQETLDVAFRIFSSRLKRAVGLLNNASATVHTLFEHMGKDDMMVLLFSDEMPLEWGGLEGAPLRNILRGVIERGGYICYARPSQKVIDDVQARSPSTSFLTPKQVETLYRRFIEGLKAAMSEGVRRQVEEQIVCLELESPIFCVPGHKYALFSHGKAVGKRRWATANYPVQQLRAGETKTRVVVELSSDVANILYDVCHAAIEDEAKKGNRVAAALLERL